MSRTTPRTLVFQDGDRTFTCNVAPRLGTEAPLWWWFKVSDGNGNRYAPFLAEKGESSTSVQTRIVEYYDLHLARRAEPRQPRYGRQARPAAAAQPTAATTGVSS